MDELSSKNRRKNRRANGRIIVATNLTATRRTIKPGGIDRNEIEMHDRERPGER